jgi:hypothetical protein
VQQELHNGNWILYLRNRIHTTEHIEEFVSLWIGIQTVHLQLGVRDSIIWRWMANGSYSTRSAYMIQFKGSYGIFNSKLILKAQVENKCKVFAWILVQEKILTAKNLQKRGWPHQDHCVLCVRMKTVGNGRKRTYDIEKRKRSVQEISTFSN